MVYLDLIYAVRYGNLTEAKKLIQTYGLSYAQQWSDGYNLLLDALKNEHADIARLLLNHSSKVNSKVKKASDTPLHIAARNGIPDIVEMIIIRGGDLNARDKNGQSPLHHAIDKERVEVTRMLLQHGAHVNVKDNFERTPLHIAVDKESFPIVEALLMKYEIDVNARDTQDKIPLHTAVERSCYQTIKWGTMGKYQVKYCAASDSVQHKGSKEIVSLLLDKGANVNYKFLGNTPLHVAAEKGCRSTVEYLLNHGASVESTSSSRESIGYTPLHLASEKGFEDIVVLLLEKGSNINAVSKNNLTPLDFAVRGGFENIVNLLLEHGALFTVKNYDLFFTSIQRGYSKIVESFLQNSFHINMFHNGMSPIHCAVKYNQEKIAELLLRHKVDVNVQDESGKTPLVYAVENKSYEITKSLLLGGAKMEKNSGILNIAVERNLTTIVEELLLYGADVNAQDLNGRTPLQIAIRNSDYEEYIDSDRIAKMVGLLLEKGAQTGVNKNGVTVLHVAAQKGYVKVVEVLLNLNTDVNAETSTGMTALHYAVLKSHREIVQLLLESGANVEPRSLKYNFLPLHSAALINDQKIVETLLKYDADVNSTVDSGETALHLAARKGHLDVVKTLLKNGCDVNILDCHQRTPLDSVLHGMELHFREQHRYEYIHRNYSIYSDSHYYDSPDYQRTFDNSIIDTLLEVAKVIKSHILQRQVAGLFVSEQYQQRNFDSLLQFKYQNSIYKRIASVGLDFRRSCETEITLMENEKINNSCISVYDILTKSTSSLSLYMKNEDVMQVFKSKSYKTKFPLYGDMIDDRFKKGLKRLEYLEEGAEFLCILNNDLDRLPWELRRRICSYLSNSDLRSIAFAHKLISNDKCDSNDGDELITSKVSLINLGFSK